MSTTLLLLSQLISFSAQSDIQLEVTGDINDGKNWVFFAPHEDEHVAHDFVKRKIDQHGGAFIILRQQGNREITLNVNNKQLRVDPNRIFTKAGRLSTLKKLNPKHANNHNLLQQAEQRAKQLSEFIIASMGGVDPDKTWVAMHNNTNGYDNDGKNGIGTISIERYQKKLDAGAKYLIDVTHSKQDEDDLFFVTDRQDFTQMQQHRWNAILQNPAVAHIVDEDDGSMSVFAEMKGIRYINIEAERHYKGVGKDHKQVQQQMIDFTFSLFEQK